ncbi:MAG: TrmB family transcriptional regulator [Zestosphaera tikiterensis]|uniref:TrmB family transcriptional regulator n=1 Tax=Zestosphaera tikiterensis TaxID=1973259 RepID=A0A2R7Y8K0_9CREN|nr:MAG: TrmB family transcriptional regulator [Zestosphaera tikiterensis]
MAGEELSKTSLKIYVYLLSSSSPQGVREIARALNLPVSTAHYHVKKLMELGLIKEESDGYRVSKVVGLEGFLVIGRKLVPRFTVYAMFFAGVLIGELALVMSRGLTPDGLIALIVSLTAFALFFIEGMMVKSKLLR